MKKSYMISTLFVLTSFIHVMCQSNVDNETIINDNISQILTPELNCFYLLNRNSFSLIHKADYYKYLAKLDTTLDSSKAKELLESFDTTKAWAHNQIEYSILLTYNDLESKIYKYLYNDTIPVRESNELNCNEFETKYDSSNTDQVYDEKTNDFIIDSLDHYYRIRLVPPEFCRIYVISKPIVDKSGKYAIFFFAINPGTMQGFGSCLISHKINDKWIVIARFDDWQS